MKTVNPLHILVLLAVLLVFSFFQLSQAKNEHKIEKKTYEETVLLSKKLKNLNAIYSDEKSVKRSIATVLKQHSLKSTSIKQTIGKSSLIISVKSMDKTALNSLMSKILNGSYNVHSFKIKRLSENRASFTMEIKW